MANTPQIDPLTGQQISQPGVTPPGQQAPQPPGQQTLAGATQSAGLAAQPSTAAGAESIGASKKAADMVGSPNQLAGQLTSAKSSSANPNSQASTGESAATGQVAAEAAQPGGSPQTLTQVSRDTSAGRAAQQDAADAARAAKYAQMFGDVGFGVAAMVSAATKQATAGTGAGGQVADDATVSGAFAGWSPTTDQLAAAKKAISTYAANPTPDAVAALQNALQAAGVPTDALQNPDQWLGKVVTQQSAGQLTQQQLEGHLTLTPTMLQSFGITDADLQMLGVTPQQVQGMSLDQFRTMVADKQQESSQQVAGLQAKLQDPNLSPNDRVAIQQQLASLQGVGAQTSAAANSAQAAEKRTDQTIDIGGTSYTADQLMSDDHFSQLIDNYLNSQPGDAIRSDLQKQMPELAQFIDANQQALQAAAGTLKDAANTVGTTQRANQNTLNSIQQQLGGASSAGSQQLSQLMSQIYPDTFGPNAKFTSTPIDLSKSGVLQLLAGGQLGADSSGGNVAQNLVSDLSSMAQSDPSGVQKLLQMSPADLQKTGLSDPAKLGQLIGSQTQTKALQSADPSQIAAAFFPSAKGPSGAPDMKTAENMLDAMQVFGDLPSSIPVSALAAGSHTDRQSAIASALGTAARGNAKSIADAIAGGNIGSVSDPLANFGQGTSGALEKQLARDIGGGIINDTTAVLADFGNDTGTLQKILNSGIAMSEGARDSIAARIAKNTAPAQLPNAGPTAPAPVINNSSSKNNLATSLQVNSANAPGAKQASNEMKKVFGGLGH